MRGEYILSRVNNEFSTRRNNWQHIKYFFMERFATFAIHTPKLLFYTMHDL